MSRKMLTVTLLLLAGLLLATACQSGQKAGTKRAANTTDQLDATDAVVKGANDQITATMDSLKTLQDFTEGDLLSTYHIYEDNVTALTNSLKTVGEQTSKLSSSVATYLAEWEKANAGISSEQVRDLAEKRRMDAADRLDSLQKSLSEATTSADALLGNLRDISTYLENDLNMAGLSAITPSMEEAFSEADNVKKALGDVSGLIDKARSAMAMNQTATG